MGRITLDINTGKKKFSMLLVPVGRFVEARGVPYLEGVFNVTFLPEHFYGVISAMSIGEVEDVVREKRISNRSYQKLPSGVQKFCFEVGFDGWSVIKFFDGGFSWKSGISWRK